MCVIATITLTAESADIEFSSEKKRTCMVRSFRALAMPGNSDYGRAQA